MSNPNENFNSPSKPEQSKKNHEKVLETFNLSDYKLCNRCTYFQYGDIAIEQNAYCCEICDPNKMEYICEECFNTCHKSCRNEEEENSAIISQTKRKFFCECGLKKHQIEKQKDQELIKACLFGEVDNNMGFEIKCYCKICKIYICYICSKECHKQKNGCDLHKGKMRYYNYDKNQNNEIICECKASRHSNKNSMIRIINKFIDKEEFGDVQHIWRLQLFNNFCTSQIFNSLFMETQAIISNFNITTQLRRDYFNLCDKFVRLGKLILKSQKYFYFKESYANLISYKNIIRVITSFKIGQYEKFGNYICSLCFFLYFVHLKKDFQKIKGLCIIDYFISNPFDRIFYKKLIFSETIYTTDIYQKYFDKNLKTYQIAGICNILLEVLDNAIYDFTIKKLDKCLKNYFTIFKICFFCLKRYLFDIDNLIKFIDTYIKIALNIFHYVDYCIKEKKTGPEFESFLETLMYYLTRINICLVFNYNDLNIEAYMDINFNSKDNDSNNNKIDINKDNNKSYFNYYSHETSKKLLRILIATSTMYGNFTLNTKNVNKTHLSQLNLILETFILTNNSYSINLKSMLNPDKFINYFFRIKKLISLVDSVSYIVKKKVKFSKKDGGINEELIETNLLEDDFLKGNDVKDFGDNKKTDEYVIIRELKKKDEEEEFEYCLRRNIFNLKERIEMNYDKFFQYKMKIDKVMKDIVDGIKNFCENDENILNLDYSVFDNFNLIFSNINKKINEDKENKNFNYNTLLRERKIKKYQTKLKLLIQERISFISSRIFNSRKAIQDLIDELILSSFDTTITKIFFMDKSNKLLSQRDCHTILYFLLIYCLTEDGLRNFCLGRNFRRVIKCFSLHPKITLEFYFYVFKGIYIYNIDIKNHKKLSKIVNDLIEYLKKYEVNNAESEFHFKEEFYYVAKIFVYLSKIVDLETLLKIKEDICEVLHNKKIINKNKFGILLPLYFIFTSDKYTDISIDNNVRMISQRFTFTEQVNKEEIPKINENLNPSFDSESKQENETKIFLELKKELLAKYLVKEKEIALKAQKLIRKESKNKIETMSAKKKQKKKDLDMSKDKNINVYKDQRDNKVDYLEALEKGDLKKLIVCNEKFIFAFLDFISEVTFFVSRKNKVILRLLRLFDLNFLKFLLSRKYIKIKYRTIVIKFIHEIYLGEEINDKEIKTDLYPNSEEYYQIMTNQNQNELVENNNTLDDDNEENEEEEENFEDSSKRMNMYKLNNLRILKSYMTFLINELDIIIKVLLNEDENDRLDLGLPYLNELIFGIKITGDIFISNDITSYITLWFFELVKSFLCKSYFFKIFYETIKQNKKLDSIDFIQEDSNKSFYVYEGELIQKNFNIYNKDLLFQKLINEICSFFKLTDFDYDFKIGKIISVYHKRNDKEFRVICLNNIKEGTSLLSEEDNIIKESNFYKQEQHFELFYTNLQNIINQYFQDFIFLPNIVLINLIFTKSDDIRIDYRNIFLNYILEIFYHCNNVQGIHSNNLFVIMNKILFYNYTAIQLSLKNLLNEKNNIYKSRENKVNDFDLKNYDETLFFNLQNFLKEKICLQLVTVKKCKLYNFFLEICCETKNIIQFFQLLGEGHNKEFQSLIVNGKNTNNYNLSNKEIKNCKNLSVFHTLCQNLEKCLELINIFTEEETDGEMTYDKLILLTENIVHFIIEFLQGTGEALYIEMYREIKPSLETIKKIIKLKIPTNPNNKRRNFIIVLKIILLDLLSSIIEEGISDLNNCQSLKDIMIIFEPISLYEEIRFVMLSLKDSENIKMKDISFEKLEGVDQLIELYKFNENFQKSIELKLSLKIFYFLKILTDVYNREEVIELFKNFEKQYKEIDVYEKVIKEINESSKNNLEKKENKKEINNDLLDKEKIQMKGNDPDKNKNIEDLTNNELIEANLMRKKTINKKAMKKKNENRPSVFMTTLLKNQNSKQNMNQNFSEENKEIISQAKADYVIYLFLNLIMQRIQIKTESIKIGRDFSLFVIPPLCLLLRSSTKNSFMENVDRDTVSTKILSLIEESDYFIYEMFYNKLTMKSFTYLDKKLFDLEFTTIEYINYLIILIQNILSLIHFFSKDPIENSEKKKRNLDVIIVLSIHMLLICFTLFVFIRYKYKLKFKHEILHSYGEKFILKKAGDNRHLSENLSEEGFLNKVGNNLSLKQIIYSGFIRSILLNREINIFFFTLILNILFLIVPNCIFLSIPLLLVANINPLLLGIVVSFEIRLKQLVMVLIFMYLIVYLFAWFAFYYFPELFEFEGLLKVGSKQYETVEGGEKLCSSIIQCYLTILSYGVRSGGGIGDVLPKVSYKNNPGYFFAEFFFVVLFHILVTWIMINLFFGIIVDTFAALREKTYKIEEDKKNICYICQITRDRAMNKNINFEKHVKNVHNIWNYVYYIAYLHINNEKNFKSLETQVLNKIVEGDTSWLPIGEENCNSN